MECRACFKIYTYNLNDDDIDLIIDSIGVEPGITEGALYYGLKSVPTDDEKFQLCLFLNEVLSNIIDKADVIKKLRDKYNLNYTLDVKFSDIENETLGGRSFNLDENVMNFINTTECFYNLNDDYFNK